MISPKIPISIIVASSSSLQSTVLLETFRDFNDLYEFEVIVLTKTYITNLEADYSELNHRYIFGFILYSDVFDFPNSLHAALESSNGDYVIFNTGNMELLHDQLVSISMHNETKLGFIWAKTDTLVSRVLHPVKSLSRLVIKLTEKVDLVGSYIFDFMIDRSVAQELSNLPPKSFWPSLYKLASQRRIEVVMYKKRSWIAYEQLEFHYLIALSNLNQIFMKQMNKFLSVGLVYILANTFSVASFGQDLFGRKQAQVPGWATLTILVTILFMVMNYSVTVIIALIQSHSAQGSTGAQGIRKYMRFNRS
jgi:hypothetical protein